MTLLDRYLTRQCVAAIATVIGVLSALTLLFALIEELDEDNANYGFAQAIEYLLLTMPRRIEELLSYGVFIGLLLALGNLAEGGELRPFARPACRLDASSLGCYRPWAFALP